MKRSLCYNKKRKWDLGKVLYIITRYSGVLFFVFLCLTEISFGWNSGYLHLNDSSNILLSRSSYTYLLSDTFPLMGGLIMIMAEVILQLRVYAIYGRNKFILLIVILMNMVSLTICALQTSGYLDAVTDPECIISMKYCRNLAISFITRRDTFTDATSMSWIPEAHPMSPLGWLIVSVFELLLFILVVRKAKYQFWCKRGSSSKEDPKVQDIMEVMAKDSTNYFTILFSVSAIGTIISFVAEAGIFRHTPMDGFYTFMSLYKFLNVYQTLAIAVMTTFAPRMLINIRSEMYNPGNLSCPASTLPWDAYHTRESFGSEEMSEF
ncbi:hypothetical protein PNOK_0927400 [Pyrrhoderma noxium]|uniref:Uncharacterized protein n=1 Tax=Pyrrhoderma noxium TaxID=2282107 RepID=A0A286U7F6_9AGAM|nr:hypothetical protein PNOK_0927400 [Pyrrhoderma noxium]